MAKYRDDATIRSFQELKACIWEDWKVNHFSFLRPGCQAMVMYRFGVWQGGLEGRFLKTLAGWLYKSMHVFCRNFYGIELYSTARIGRRLRISHQSGIVLDPKLVIGDDCSIRQGVTIGRVDGQGLKERANAPVIGDRVRIGLGAAILGGITVGDDVVIGPYAVVTRNVPSGSIVSCAPPRVFGRPPSTGKTASKEAD
ncbi:serine acetyltransferase [Marinobacter bryozoorum]|uniref:serine O-acetyltransferase n=1 Tax=Marinobacter bryozoorum TaxID=256324 RepID=UPI002002D5B8|nr:serine acetyltransferase [Marinobacter bryozoorum]MCK7544047.1 serine acetyltransferase [Marinobacter bryozoorum]